MDRRNGRLKKLSSAAYLYAEAAPDENGVTPPMPYELILLQNIDRFGVKAVMGRAVLAYHEIRNMRLTENIVTAYRNRKAAKDWAKWAQECPDAHKLLSSIEREIYADD